eukprot:SAG11_NODE_25_length_23789_cov_23.813592_13_plen_66_part_00
MKGPSCAGLPLRVGPVIAGHKEIRALWWGEVRQSHIGDSENIFAEEGTVVVVLNDEWCRTTLGSG